MQPMKTSEFFREATLRICGNLDIEVTALVVWIKKSTMYRNPGMGVQFLSKLPKPVKKNILENVDQVMILGDNNKSA